ncbi:MAG: D-alanyl-D-alanine carboxypeptidase family protein [Pseudorhodoplanes sp.]|nr:D-alanyl-D-alanine carboxypeptidase family protein [Pseudorhodoplanes sp.]
MRRFTRIFGRVAVLLLTAGILASAGAAPNPSSATKKDDGGFQTSVPTAILIEAESGTVLYEKNADQLVAPASLAKLMTSEVVFNEIKEGNLKLDEEFVISENAWRRGGAPSGGSTMFAAIHSRIKVSDLLQGVIIQSGNDACIALAEGIAGNEAAFARLMNGRARELGLEKSHFTNAAGLPDPDMRVTVRELAKLAQHLIATYPEFYKWYGEREFTWNKIRQLNRNPLLTMGIGADGLKTGYTSEAGYNLVGSAVQNNLRLIVVVAGAKTANERADEARKLLNFGFTGFESRLLFAEGQSIGDARLFGGESRYVPLVAAGRKAVRLMVPKNSGERILARIVYRGPVSAPVEKGKQIGVLKVWRGENVALEVPLEAAESVDEGSLTRRAFDAVGELFGGMVRAGIKKL